MTAIAAKGRRVCISSLAEASQKALKIKLRHEKLT